MKKPTALRAALACTVGIASLTGCSAIGDLMHGQATATYPSKAEFDAKAKVAASWIPADATSITERSATDGQLGAAVVLLTSAGSLPDSCVTAERRSAPTLNLDGAPDIYDPKLGAAHVCGAWTVMHTGTGWYGWTPNAEDR